MGVSNSQLEKLAKHLRAVGADEDVDPTFLDVYSSYREEFVDAVTEVLTASEQCADVIEASSRLKTLTSVRQKLRRQSIRLPQIADIGGCRIVVPGRPEQDRAVADLVRQYPTARVKDYRDEPQNGYRAVHIVIQTAAGHAVEMQVRTRAQNIWANVSEKIAEVDPPIKYGGGEPRLQSGLDELSRIGKDIDDRIGQLEYVRGELDGVELTLVPVQEAPTDELRAQAEELIGRIADLRSRLRDGLAAAEEQLDVFDQKLSVVLDLRFPR